jgi:sarcosine dehydrogenase
MEWLASSPIASAADGRVLYTQLLNERGGIEADVTIVPLPAAEANAHRTFYVITGGATCTRDADHIITGARQRGLSGLTLTDVTDDHAVLALMGPEARDVLARVVPPSVDLSNTGFPCIHAAARN